MSSDRSWRENWFYFIARRVLLVWYGVRYRFKTYGSENVPSEGGCLIAANHASYLDPPAVSIGIKHRVVRFLARDSLFKPGISAWVMRHVHGISIDRNRGDISALRKALSAMKKGHVVGLFPEGTRSPDGELHEAKGGVGFLISKAGVPVVPAYISGSYEAYPKGAKRGKSGRISVSYGKPIDPSEIAKLGSSRESYEKIAHQVMARIAELKEEFARR